MGGSMMPWCAFGHGEISCGRFVRARVTRESPRHCHQFYDLSRRLADVVVDDLRKSNSSWAASSTFAVSQSARLFRRRLRCRGRSAGAPVRPSSAAAGTPAVASGIGRAHLRARPAGRSRAARCLPARERGLDRRPRACRSGRRCARSRARGARRRRSGGRTRRRRRRSSARRRPRPGAARGSSPRRDSRTRGGARGCSAATVPLPTAVGPASTTRRLRRRAAARSRGASQELAQRRALPRRRARRGASTGEISSSSMMRSRLRRRSPGCSVRNSRHPQRRRRRPGRLAPRRHAAPRAALTTRVATSCLDGGAGAAGGDRGARRRRPGRPRAGACDQLAAMLAHLARRVASIAVAEPSGPAARMLRRLAGDDTRRARAEQRVQIGESRALVAEPGREDRACRPSSVGIDARSRPGRRWRRCTTPRPTDAAGRRCGVARGDLRDDRCRRPCAPSRDRARCVAAASGFGSRRGRTRPCRAARASVERRRRASRRPR